MTDGPSKNCKLAPADLFLNSKSWIDDKRQPLINRRKLSAVAECIDKWLTWRSWPWHLVYRSVCLEASWTFVKLVHPLANSLVYVAKTFWEVYMYSTCKTLPWWHINLRQNPLKNKCTLKEHNIKKQSKLPKNHLNSSTGESCYTSSTQVWMMQPRLEQWGKPDEEIGFQVATLKSTICILYQKRYAFSNSWAGLLTPWGELLVSSGITCQVI